MLQEFNQMTIIRCDKCEASSQALTSLSGDVFHREGWRMNRRAKKYVHLCPKHADEYVRILRKRS